MCVNCLIARPLRTVAAPRAAVGARVESPRELRGSSSSPRVVYVEARGDAPVRPLFDPRDRGDDVARAPAASPLADRHVDGSTAACAAMTYWWATKLSSSCDWNMRSATTHRAPCRSTVSNRSAQRRRTPGGGRRRSGPRYRSRPCGSFVPGSFPVPSQAANIACSRMIDLILPGEAHRRELDGPALRILAARHGVRARISLEEVVEAAVLLKDVDDVRDLPGARGIELGEGAIAAHVGQRRLRAVRAPG